MKHISELIPEALKPSLAPVKQESKRQRIGDTLEVALLSQRIIGASNEELSQALRYVMVKIGLRADNWPSDFEKEILLNHIFQNYGGHSVAEIRLAFDMAIAGKLDVDATCYENFSCLYFSQIMNAYRLWAKEEMRQIKSALVPEKKIDRLTIDIEYCYFMQKEIDLLPCRMKKLIHIKTG